MNTSKLNVQVNIPKLTSQDVDLLHAYVHYGLTIWQYDGHAHNRFHLMADTHNGLRVMQSFATREEAETRLTNIRDLLA